MACEAANGRRAAVMVPGGPALVLASGSATRRALMEAAGLRFTVAPAPVDEAALKREIAAGGGGCAAAALALADAKAACWQGAGLAIGADQILECEGEWFDKPPDLAAARAQLRRLRGRTHRLRTAVVCRRDGERVWSHEAAPALTMRPFSDAFLDAYLAVEGEAVLGSVGAYRLEGVGMQLFSQVDGEHAAVLGLPMLALLTFLRAAGAVLA